MDGILDAARAFFDGLTSVEWGPLTLAVVCHLLKVVARTRAWRNIVQAAYPQTDVRWRSVYGAYVDDARVECAGLVLLKLPAD